MQRGMMWEPTLGREVGRRLSSVDLRTWKRGIWEAGAEGNSRWTDDGHRRAQDDSGTERKPKNEEDSGRGSDIRSPGSSVWILLVNFPS